MDEKEVKELDKEVLEGIDSDPEFEKAYFKERRNGLEKELKSLGVEYRMARFTRDDNQLKKVRDAVSKAKKLIDFIKGEESKLK